MDHYKTFFTLYLMFVALQLFVKVLYHKDQLSMRNR